MRIELNTCQWCSEETLNPKVCDECLEEQKKNEERNKRKYKNSQQKNHSKQPSWKNEQRWKEKSKGLF